MGAILTPGTTAEQILTHYSTLVQDRFAESDASLGDLLVRKYDSRLEPEGFYKQGENNPFDKARFHLIISNEREEWGVKIDLIFHSRKRLLTDGSMAGEGVQFNVISEEGKSRLVDYFNIDADTELEGLSAENWCLFWFRKLMRSPNISSIFAHKEFVRELEH